MKVFLTSDLHLLHKHIVKYTNRGVATTQEEHDEWIINLWNSTVGKDDCIYSLGDFAFTGSYDRLVEIIGRLNGRKYFILGNHCDSKPWKKIKENRNTDSRLGSIAAVERLYTTSFDIENEKKMFVFCHFALRVWWNQHYGSMHCFGHSHGSLVTNDRSIDVGLDSAYNLFGEHRFFTIEEVYDILSKREIISGDYHG